MKKKKNNKKSINTMTKIFNILIIVSSIFLIYTISLISKIETAIITSGIIVLIIVDIFLLIFINKLLKKQTLLKYIAFILLSSLLIAGQTTVGYFIYKTYSSVTGMNKSNITYTSALVIMNKNDYTIEDLKDKKIGIVEDKTSIDGYIIGTEIIEDKKLEENNTIINYDSNSALIADLYNETIDAIIISENYPTMFKSIEEYKKIEEETKIIFTKSKKLNKKQIAKYTGEEIKNFNSKTSINEPFTVLVMGVDTVGVELSKNSSGNGDALMLITFNPKTLNATILSIPRDSYVPIACFANQKENKITHAAWNGESCMIKTIENFTGINIDYYIKINFKGVVNLVNALGGIDVDVPIEFCEQDSNRNFGNQQCLKEGFQTINGEQALALARHRKTLLTGDLQRGQNQQLVIMGIANKIKSIKSANQALKILDSLSKSIDTNFTTEQMLSGYEIAKAIIATSSSGNLINMQQLYLSGSSQYIYDESMQLELYNYIVNKSSLKQVVNAMKKNLGQASAETTKTMNFNIEEKFEMTTIGTDNLMATQLFTLLPNFTGKTIEYAKSWLSQYNINVNIEEVETTEQEEGTIISQSLPSGKRVDYINSSGITFKVAIYGENEENDEDIENNENNENEENNEDNNDENNNENENNENENNNENPEDTPNEDTPNEETTPEETEPGTNE